MKLWVGLSVEAGVLYNEMGVALDVEPSAVECDMTDTSSLVSSVLIADGLVGNVEMRGAQDVEASALESDITDTSSSVRRVLIADGMVGNVVVGISPKSRRSKGQGGHLTNSQSEDFVLDRKLDEIGSGKPAVVNSIIESGGSKKKNRSSYKRKALYFSKNPLLGDVHMLSQREEVECGYALDADFATDCTVSELDVCESDVTDEVQFEIPNAFIALGDNEFAGQRYTESADVAQLMGLSDTTVDYILNYGSYNGHLDDYRIESFAASKLRFRHDGRSFLKVVREILDSGASHSMSGDIRRTKAKEAVDIAIRGFNDSKAAAESRGLNSDGVMELYIPTMPEDLVLLCLHDYAKKGCVYLTEFGGRVLHLTPSQQEALERFLSSFPSVLTLDVQNGVYVVDRSADEDNDNYAPHRRAVLAEEAYWAGVANRAGLYFNGRVTYNSVSERILGLMMSGLSFGAIRACLKHQSIGGVHPDITLEALARYERDHGRSPDVVQMALAHQIGNQKAFERQKAPLKRRGQRIEFDAFSWDANDRATRESKRQGRQSLSKAEREQEDLLDMDEMGVYSERKRVDKLKERGGADHCEIFMDCYSGKVFGKLRKPNSKSLDSVKECIAMLQGLGVKIEKFAADSGYLSDSQYRTFTSDVVAHLLECNIEIERAEAYNHSIGTAFIENMVKLIKQLMRQAYRYVETNVNMKKLAFKELDILKLWGEIFHWAINVINLYPSPRVEGMTREEAFSGVQPNIQQMRLLPIFSTVLVWKGVPKRRKRLSGKKNDDLHYSDFYDKPSFVYGLYVGFELTTPGCIRVAVKTDKGMRVISTSKFKGVSEGGQIDISADVQRAAHRMIMDGVNVQLPVDGSQEADESEPVEQYAEEDEAVIDGAERKERDSIIRSQDAIVDTNMERVDEEHHEFQETESENWELESEDVLDKVTELKEIRGRELNIRNKLVYHDKSEYNPVNHRGRDERAARRRSDAMLGLYTSLRREGWLAHAKAQEAVEFEAMAASRDFVLSVEDMIDERNLASAHRLDEASERRRDIAEAMFSFFQESGSGYFTDWSNFCSLESYFVDLFEECFVKFGEAPADYEYEVIDGFRAVTENVPRNFGEALRHPLWGEAARKELNDLLEKAMIRIPADIALEGIANGSDCLTLFPVYESKIRDGKLVHKVRLVADGRRHATAGPTYSSTPSREEFLMFVDMIARQEWEWCHVDENRAFLNADRQDQIPLFARLKGEKDWFQIIRALYGLKTSTRDHSIAAALRLEKLGFVRRGMCTNIFEKFALTEDGRVVHVIVYQYVDDYFFAGNTREAVERCVAGFRSVVATSEPAFDPEKGLGMEFVRDRSKRCISIRMTATIQRMYDEFVTEANKSKKVDLPIPKGKFIVEKSEFDQMEIDGISDGKKVDSAGRSVYMKQVGAILWVAGVRFDINLPTVYLTWFTHEPREHHLLLAERVIRYLGQTKDEPLVLGGFEPAQIRTLSDCSLGTGPKGRSIIAYGTRMSANSGFIATKVKATQYMALSSFEGEINGYFESFRTSARYLNIAKEMSYKVDPVRVIIGDNEKAIQFIKGEAEGKGIRHALRRFSYMREEFLKGSIDLQWLSGKILVVDAMTKVVDVEAYQRFRSDVLGHALLSAEGISG